MEAPRILNVDDSAHKRELVQAAVKAVYPGSTIIQRGEPFAAFEDIRRLREAIFAVITDDHMLSDFWAAKIAQAAFAAQIQHVLVYSGSMTHDRLPQGATLHRRGTPQEDEAAIRNWLLARQALPRAA